jgi:ribosomal protein S12 methylthiotransferase
LTKKTDLNQIFFLDQHGCAKNQVDGELIISHLVQDGWSRTENPEEASLIIINSCGFIESAKKEALDSVFTTRNMFPDKKIILAGCLAERYAESLSQTLQEVDGIFGNGKIDQISSFINDVFQNSSNEAESNPQVQIFPQVDVCDGNRSELLNLPGSAYVKITEGCNNHCSFCAIPIIRGELRSRSVSKIIEEIKSLLTRGIFEINLIGQDLASYGKGKNESTEVLASFNSETSPLATLLSEISKLTGDFWIRLLYIHPDNFPQDILPVIANDKRILPYFDIPFQSGDDKIIKDMNRKGSAQKYIQLVEKIRSSQQNSFYNDVALRTTFLCGFPGETEENAKNTVEFLKNIQSDWSGCFAYSREDDTVAGEMKKQVSAKKSKSRCDVLTELQTQITQEKLKRHVGKIYKVLIEEIIPTEEEEGGIAIGRAWFQAPEVDGATVIYYDLDDEVSCKKIFAGNLVEVKIQGVSAVDVYGVLV